MKGNKEKSNWSVERWYLEILEDGSLLDDESCPADRFPKDEWIELLTCSSCKSQDFI